MSCLLLLALCAPPNLVFVLADDLGSFDVGWRGSAIATPALDRLAAGGAKLDAHYVLPVCSPTRAALMTGRYPMRHGLQVGVVRPWANYGLPLEERTLAQALKDAGYATAIVGKWHLGHHAPGHLPTRRGFDRQYGCYNGQIDYYTHVRDGGHDWHRDDKASRDEGYATDLLGREAAKFVEDVGGTKPFFLYLAFTAVHAPHQVPEKYTAGYTKLTGVRKTYAGMVSAMDEAVGRVVAALEKKKLLGQTLIVFSSDNGGPQPGKVTDNGKLRAAKGTVYEGGVRVAALAHWPGRIKPGTAVAEPIHVADWYPTLITLAGGSLDQKLPLDGKDVWKTVTEGKPSPHAHVLINATPTGGALRSGKWKLHVKPAGVELYDLEADVGEKTDVAAKHPERVKELRAAYEALAKQAVPPKYHERPAGFKVPKVWGEKE